MSSQLVRSLSKYQASGTTLSLSFTEPAALDSTHLLVAIVHLASATAITTPSGWTSVTGGGSSGANQVRMYVKQGDGTTNGISVTVTSAAAVVTLAAYEGFVSVTPLWSQGGSVTNVTSTAAQLPAGYSHGVGIATIGLSSTTSTWGPWTGVTRIGSISDVSQRLDAGDVDYDGTLVDITQSWGGSRSIQMLGAILPLAEPAPPSENANLLVELGFTEGKGSVSLDGSGNGNHAFIEDDQFSWGTPGANSSHGIKTLSYAGATFYLGAGTLTAWSIGFDLYTNSVSFSETSLFTCSDTFSVGALVQDLTISNGLDVPMALIPESRMNVIITDDGSNNMKVYINGEEQANGGTSVALSKSSPWTFTAVVTDSYDGVVNNFRVWDAALSQEEIDTWSVTPASRIVGTAKGGTNSTDSFSVIPPSGADSYIAVMCVGNNENGTEPRSPATPPGWTQVDWGRDTYATWYYFKGAAGAGATGWHSNYGWGTSLVITGFRGDATIEGSSRSNTLTAPSITTSQPSQAVRYLTGNPWPEAPSGTVPESSSIQNVLQYNGSGVDYAIVAVGHDPKQLSAGATGTAAFAISPFDSMTAHTVILNFGDEAPTGPDRAMTYVDTSWDTGGTSTGDGTTVYKQVTLTNCRVGDVIVAFGVQENYTGSGGSRYIWDVTAGGAKTGSWTATNSIAPSANADTEFYAGYATVTTAGTITLQVGLRGTGSLHMGVGAYLIPSEIITGPHGFVGNGVVGYSNALIPATLSRESTVIYMGGDWVAQTMGTTPLPSGGTVYRSYADSAYATWTTAWSGQASGTRDYGPSGLSGRDTTGILFSFGSTASTSPVTARWFKGDGTPLVAYRLTGSGLIELE